MQRPYNGYVIETVSLNRGLGRSGRNKKWGEWYPGYRIYKEGVARKMVHKEMLDRPYDSQPEADRSAMAAAEAWIDQQKK